MRYFVALLLMLFLLPCCDYINPEEDVPAYIKIDQIDVDTSYAQLSDAWVYINDNLAGAYDLPAEVPVLAEGEKTISIKAGVKINGIAVTRGPYPFYKTYKVDTLLQPEKTIELNPATSYLDNLTQKWKETFEDVALTTEPVDSGQTNFSKEDTVSDAPSGKVGVVGLEPDSSFTIQTIESFMLPYDRDVYLEISYKTDYYFELAWIVENLLDGSIAQNRIYQFNPTDEWQHVYIYLSRYIRDYNTQYSKFRLLLGSYNSDDKKNYYYIDNIRLLHY